MRELTDQLFPTHPHPPSDEGGTFRDSTFSLHKLSNREAALGPVVLIPGIGTGSAVFTPPQQRGLPQVLAEAGYDVWLLDWRPTGVLPWTVEDVASEDIPYAMQRVARVTQKPVKVIAHCIGAIATMLAAIEGRIPEVTTIITNAVSLHPVIPTASYVRMRALLPFSNMFPAFLDPQWSTGTAGFWPTLFRLSAQIGLRGCPDPTCKLIRWLYGDVWQHDHITDATHDWLLGQFHQVPVAFFQHLGTCIQRGHMRGLKRLPQTDARCVFLTGMANRCFLPISQIKTYHWMQEQSPRKDHGLHLLATYGHLDVFVGDWAVRETYPTILQELAA